MSPEQARGLQVDARTDVWALACVAWESLTREPVAVGNTPDETASRVCAFDLAPLRSHPSISASMQAVFRRAFAFDIDERFADAASFAAAFRDALPKGRDDAGRSRRRKIAAIPVAERKSNRPGRG